MISDTVIETESMSYLSLHEFGKGGIRHFFSTGKSNLPAGLPFSNRDAFVMVKQVHGDDILIIDKPVDNMRVFAEQSAQKQCDAIITNQSNLGIGVVSADCLPALLYDPVQSVIASVHAGWRGSIKLILSKVVYRMMEQFNCRPEDILAGIGPVIGSCCYTVGEAVTEPLKEINPAWDRFLKPSGNGKSRLDLAALNTAQIEEAGLLRDHIFSLGLCTSCNEELFPSYRRDGVGTGRIISGIILEE